MTNFLRLGEMAIMNDKDTRRKSAGDGGGTSPRTVSSADLYDPAILDVVQREIEREEAGEQDPEGYVPIPELPAPPEHKPVLWMARQIKRVLVVGALLWLAVYAVRAVFFSKPPDVAWEEGRASVPLPEVDAEEAERNSALLDRLKNGQSDLAAGRFEAGIEELTSLARDAGGSPAARKAMLTLAATYRFQKNDPENALKWYRLFIEKHRDDRQRPATLLRMGGYLEELGRLVEAKAAYRQLIDEHGDRAKEVEAAKRALERLEKP